MLARTVRTSLTSNLCNNNIVINNQSRTHPDRNNKDSNSKLAINNSNRREEHHVIIEDRNHDDDYDNYLLVNSSEAGTEVSINSPTVSNETTNVTADESRNYNVNNNV